MTREDGILAAETTDDRYMKKLVGWKTTMEEIEARQAEFHRELANMEVKLANALEEDSASFGEFLAREKEIGVGLVFEKSGRTVGAKAMDAMIRRKVCVVLVPSLVKIKIGNYKKKSRNEINPQ